MVIRQDIRLFFFFWKSDHWQKCGLHIQFIIRKHTQGFINEPKKFCNSNFDVHSYYKYCYFLLPKFVSCCMPPGTIPYHLLQYQYILQSID